MERKIIKIASIKELKPSQTGQKRYSLYENRSNFCIFTENANFKLPAIGAEVLCQEQEITLADGTKTNGWYFVEPFTKDTVNSEVNRYFNHKVTMAKELQTAALKMRVSNLKAEELSSILAI